MPVQDLSTPQEGILTNNLLRKTVQTFLSLLHIGDSYASRLDDLNNNL